MAIDRVTFTSIEFRNYKAFEHYSVSLQDMNVLVGENNSGKSTILGAFRALDIAMRRARTRNPEYMYGPKGYTFGYHLSDDSFPISLENVHTNYSNTDSNITFRLSNRNKLTIYFPSDGGWSLIPEPAERPVKCVRAFKDAYPVSIAVVPILGPVEHKEPLLQFEHVQRNLSTHLASRHFRNHWYHMPDGFKAFAARVRQTWPGMEILPPERVEPGSPELSMFCSENRIDRELYWAGFGFQIWCQLLTHLCRAEGSAILVVDEPEVYLHPDVQRQLLSMLRSADVDVLLAPHSSEIIAEADPSEILLIDKKLQSAKRLRDITGVQSVLSRIGSIQNLTLTRLARNRTILFTEGSKDFNLLRQFARRLGFSVLASGADLTPVTSDGFSSKDRVKGLSWGLQKTLGRSLNIAVVFDRDYLCEEEVNATLEDLRGQVTFAHIHGRKEIENYLLVPAVVQRAFDRELLEQARRNSSAPQIPTESVTEILDEITRPLKIQAQSQYVARRSEFFRRTKRDNATITAATLSWFEHQWSALETRMMIVPGKEVLGTLRERIQTKYLVSLTNHKIIDSFKHEEIPEDLVSLLRDLSQLRSPQSPEDNAVLVAATASEG